MNHTTEPTRSEHSLLLENEELITNVLHFTDPTCVQILPKILHLSQVIFNAIPERSESPQTIESDTATIRASTHHGSLDEWRNRLALPGALIVYITARQSVVTNLDRPLPSPVDQGEEDRKIVAFLFIHPRTHGVTLHGGSTTSVHIWIAGVLPEMRRRGCLEKMMKRVEEELKGIRGTADKAVDIMLTIRTIPTRFPAMWKWLQARDWKVEMEMDDGKIMLSKPLRVT